jgi:hypothetical protein
MKLNVGVSRKVGLPDYGSVGASCNLELEVEYGLLDRDVEAFHAKVRDAYVAAHQAVQDELARLRGPEAEVQEQVRARAADGAVPRDGHPDADGGPAGRRTRGEQARVGKPASPSQVQAIRAIAREREADLETILRQGYEVGQPEELTLRQASALIDRLKGTEQDSAPRQKGEQGPGCHGCGRCSRGLFFRDQRAASGTRFTRTGRRRAGGQDTRASLLGPQHASVSSDRRAYEAADQYLRAVFLIPDLS